MKKFCLRVAAAMLTFLLLWICPYSALAQEEETELDLDRLGSITFHLEYEGKPVQGGNLAICRVGELREDGGTWHYVPVAELQESGIDMDDLEDRAMIAQVEEAAEEAQLPAQEAVFDEKGEMHFSDLVLGLYLVRQTEPAPGYEKLQTFLITLPMVEDRKLIYDVDALPKPELEKTPEPHDPTLPQTGQLYWPLPVLAVPGTALVIAGVFLCCTKRKERGNTP